jgi:hypothetical protein
LRNQKGFLFKLFFILYLLKAVCELLRFHPKKKEYLKVFKKDAISVRAKLDYQVFVISLKTGTLTSFSESARF